MRKINTCLRYQVLVGVVLGLLVAPPHAARAQFAVYDAASHVSQLEEMVESAKRWVEQIQQYTRMYQNAINQLTTMKGVLTTLDKELAKNLQLVRFVSDVGKIIRGSYALKQQLESLITYNIKYLKNMDDRLRNGIFDPSADMNDLEDYLKFGIGRNAQDTVAKMQKLAANDTQLEAWLVRQQQVNRDIAIAQQALKDATEKLKEEEQKPADVQSQVATLNEVILQQTNLLAVLMKERSELQSKIEERVKMYGLRVQDMENFAFSVISVADGWTGLNQTKDTITQTLNDLMDGK